MMSGRLWSAYWITLGRLVTDWRYADGQLDIPIPAAFVRSRWASAWTALVGGSSVWIVHPDWLPHLAARLPVSPAAVHLVAAGLGLALLGVAMPIVYGFLRLYTLISHVLTLNVFKTAGRRLRLLNLETTLLSLTAPFCAGYALTRFATWLGAAVMAFVTAYTLLLLASGYNQVFVRRHRKQFGLAGALALWLAATAVTIFVLAIGALAIAVTLSVLAFFALLIIRSFHAPTPH
jgi:hypothetical protein